MQRASAANGTEATLLSYGRFFRTLASTGQETAEESAELGRTSDQTFKMTSCSGDMKLHPPKRGSSSQ